MTRPKKAACSWIFPFGVGLTSGLLLSKSEGQKKKEEKKDTTVKRRMGWFYVVGIASRKEKMVAKRSRSMLLIDPDVSNLIGHVKL
jgi:hypothetical protein